MTGWMDDAACATVSPELFFSDTETNWKQVEAALKICGGCSVRLECLADAPADDRWSIRGGLTQGQRRRLRVGVA